MLELIAALLLAPAAAQGSDQIEVTAARFFALDSRTEPPVISETTTIPYRPETSCFGWVIEVTPRPGQVTLREELRLPAPAPNWGTGEGMTVHPDRSGATAVRPDGLDDGILTGEWCLSEGDPSGAHTISVHAGDRLLHRFEFTVMEAPRRI
ncbi:MAG TPA: hypothetical protein VF603_15165 [Allosphingosinicella sp.]|jgi:hypothetical protein